MRESVNFFSLIVMTLLAFLPRPCVAVDSIKPGVTYSELINFVETNKQSISSIEDFLMFFDFSTPWIAPLVINSRSLQDGDLFDPRVLFISPPKELIKDPTPFTDRNSVDEFLVFSINGTENQRNGNNIEVISFDSQKPLGNQLVFQDIDIDGRRVLMSEQNPIKCSKCHGLNPRLIHDPPARWPGFLNSLTNAGEVVEDPVFSWREKNSHPRFSELRHVLGAFSANTQLNELIRIANGKRMIYFIQNSPDYSSYKFAVGGASIACENLSEFIPEEFLPRHKNTDWLINSGEEIRSFSSGISLFEADTHQRDALFVSQFDIINQKFVEKPLVLLRWLFESRGIGIAHWFSGTLEGSYQHSQSFLNLEFYNLLKEHEEGLKTLVNIVPVLTDLPNNRNNSIEKHDKVCNELKELSLEQFRKFPPRSQPRPYLSKMVESHLPLNHFSGAPRSKCASCHSGYNVDYTGDRFKRGSRNFPLVMMVCANCHTGGDRVGPEIPFNDQREFDNFITREPGMGYLIQHRLSPHAFESLRHMPPVLQIPSSKLQKINSYLESLSQ